jgi:spore photoproduct lyase
MLFNTIYVEEEVRGHPRVQEICKRFSDTKVVFCHQYGEVFNKSAQNFRLQKMKPALILAKKHKNFVLPAPEGYGIGSPNNFYFSHMLNCVYDCRYCFLQGMYQSANYVLFVNYEDFFSEIGNTLKNVGQAHFFSGYDCDSLALEPVSGFAKACLTFFAGKDNALVELRTKSTQIRSLLNTEPMTNVVVAYSLSPANIVAALEHKTPSLDKRIESINKLSEQGWKIGLRFDPLIYFDDYQNIYRQFFKDIFSRLNLDALHSVSLGVFRLPSAFYKKVAALYPDEKLFASPMMENNGMMSYRSPLESELMQFCEEELLNYIDRTLYFPCRYDI